MSELIIYILKVIAIQGLLFAFYSLCFRRTARHSSNRAYLISSILLSFIIPLIQLPVTNQVTEVIQESPIVIWFSEPSNVVDEVILTPAKQKQTFSFWSFLPWIYSFIVFTLLARSMFYLLALKKLKKHSEPIKKDWFTIFKTTQVQPFSFFSNVFLPKHLFGSKAFDQVLAHECVHVRQLHSLDRLLLDFVVSLFWFNPFIYWYRNALIEIHEYQADAGVLEEFNDPIAYQEILFAQLQSPQYSGLVSHFNFQMIKKRIVMMNKQKKGTGLIYAITIPVTLMLVFSFSSKELMQPLDQVGNEITSLIGPMATIGDYTSELFAKENSPSISPVKGGDLTRLASGFGMRKHPIYKVEKFHSGLDFIVADGTEVMATGDGIVVEAQTSMDGYGMRLVIDHGEGVKTRYAHLSEFRTAVGAKVEKGKVIALSGNSGASTIPHLHYEVIVDDEAVDPKIYIDNLEFAKPYKQQGDTQSNFSSSPGTNQDSNTPSILPLKEPENVRMTSGFGMRDHPVDQERKMHFGVDFACKIGTEIISTADGEVSKVQLLEGKGYGNMVVVDHGNGFKTRYAQLSQINVKVGDRVKRGQVIALSGNSGASTAPHLHYEVMKGDRRVNPASYIKNYRFTIKEVKTSEAKEVNDSNPANDVKTELLVKKRELDERTKELKLLEKELALAAEQLAKEEQERSMSEQKRAELAKREAILMAREKELYQAKKRLVDEEVRRAQMELMKSKELEEMSMAEELRHHEERESVDISSKIKVDGVNDPLIVLDGEIMERKEISDLHPSTIENITVLKDKSAKQKYGKRGKNGVIEINTKSKEKTKSKTKNKNN